MLLSIIIFIITLLVLVLIHELGHFLLAKRFGIRVLEFGFGIPPRLWGKKFGETIYSINALPIGGFVRLLGEDEEDSKVLEKPNSFASKKPWVRILVVVSGVVMNLILAWLLFYTVIILQNFKIISPSPESGVYVGKVEAGFPAERAGIKAGNKILSIDGEQVSNFDTARSLIKSKGEQAISFKIKDSQGEERIIPVTPRKVKDDTLVGVVFTPFLLKEYKTAQEKVFSGITYSYDLTKLTFIGLGSSLTDLLNGDFNKVSQSVSGPVGIAGITNEILSEGWRAVIPYLWFVGVISLTLSIFNILPIPALDGGRLLFLVIEAIFKKRVRADIEKWVHQIGFAILLALALLITYSDISKLLR